MSEQIALGVQSAGDTGVQYDQRLFNMSAVRIAFGYFLRKLIVSFFFVRVLAVASVMMKLIMSTIKLGIPLQLLLLKSINQLKQQKIIMMMQKRWPMLRNGSFFIASC